MPEKISVIGGGSWATALTKILTMNEHEVRWWLRQRETVEYIRKYNHNPKYLSSVEFDLPDENITSNIEEAISESNWILFAVPSYYFTPTVAELSTSIFKGKTIISAIKGIVQEGHVLISQYLHQKFDIPQEKLANISGPCHAEEVAAEKLSYLTLSSPDETLAKNAAALFENRFLTTFWSTDMVGTEYASVLKNVYALAVGITVGLGYGDNFRAVLVSRAMQEMQYFLDSVQPANRDILSSAYLGDTLVTAYSQYSRNRTFGLMIGKGYSINSAILELNMVAEGYYSTKSIKEIADKHQLHLPIAEAVYHILYQNIAPAIEFRVLTEKFN